MLKIVNEETGKDVLTIKDNGETVINGKVTEAEADVKEAFEKAKEKEEN